MSGQLTTHVLDTANGRPAADVRIELASLAGDTPTVLKEVRTNANGRTDEPLLSGDAFEPGRYVLLFHVGDYFRASGATLSDPAFLEVVPVQFGIANAEAHYHVPLLVSPWSYSVYRGS